MGIELEWFILLIVCIVGKSVFQRFEGETPLWRLIAKWFLTMGITYWLYSIAGHWGSLLFLGIFLSISITLHFVWCKWHGIHPLKATPTDKYYQLRGWHKE
jgi:hypothetical protein